MFESFCGQLEVFAKVRKQSASLYTGRRTRQPRAPLSFVAQERANTHITCIIILVHTSALELPSAQLTLKAGLLARAPGTRSNGGHEGAYRLSLHLKKLNVAAVRVCLFSGSRVYASAHDHMVHELTHVPRCGSEVTS